MKHIKRNLQVLSFYQVTSGLVFLCFASMTSFIPYHFWWTCIWNHWIYCTLCSYNM